jgi:endonuclease YncB( thermonuclease family)
MVVGVSNAFADPCEGELPRAAGVAFSGTVRYVIDGDGWCVGQSSDPSTWIEVRSSDFDAAELRTPEGRRGKAIAERALLGRQMRCRSATGRDGHTVITYDRVLAVCSIDGRRVADMLREAGVPEGGN